MTYGEHLRRSRHGILYFRYVSRLTKGRPSAERSFVLLQGAGHQRSGLYRARARHLAAHVDLDPIRRYLCL